MIILAGVLHFCCFTTKVHSPTQLKKCQSIKWNYNCSSNNNICLLLSLCAIRKSLFFIVPCMYFFQTLIYSKLPPFFPTRHTNLKAMNLSLSQQRRMAWHAWLVHCHCYGFMISDRL